MKQFVKRVEVGADFGNAETRFISVFEANFYLKSVAQKCLVTVTAIPARDGSGLSTNKLKKRETKTIQKHRRSIHTQRKYTRHYFPSRSSKILGSKSYIYTYIINY